MRKKFLFLLPLVLLGSGCNDEYVTGLPVNSMEQSGVLIPDSHTIGSGITAPSFQTPAGLSKRDFSLIVPQ